MIRLSWCRRLIFALVMACVVGILSFLCSLLFSLDEVNGADTCPNRTPQSCASSSPTEVTQPRARTVVAPLQNARRGFENRRGVTIVGAPLAI